MARLVVTVGLFGALLLLVADQGCGGTTTVGAPVDGSIGAAVPDAQSDAPIACHTGYDCSSLLASAPTSSVPCCADNACRFESNDDCTDANAQLVRASDYNQTCTTDKDCVAVAEGNFCFPGTSNCTNAAIRMSAYAEYQADVARTRAGSCYPAGDCGVESGPCCVAGKCQVGAACPLAPNKNCAFGGACTPTQSCMGGVAGCTSNCQCLAGKWQAPCPVDLPPNASACGAEGAQCGYVTATNPCGAANCYCRGGAWTCGPTCAVPPAADASTDGAVAD
jgi:hypothetical protein